MLHGGLASAAQEIKASQRLKGRAPSMSIVDTRRVIASEIEDGEKNVKARPRSGSEGWQAVTHLGA